MRSFLSDIDGASGHGAEWLDGLAGALQRQQARVTLRGDCSLERSPCSDPDAARVGGGALRRFLFPVGRGRRRGKTADSVRHCEEDGRGAPMAVTPCRTLRSRPTPPRARTRAASGVAAPPRSRQWQRGLKRRQRRAPSAPPQRRVLRNRRRPCTWTCAPRWPKCPWHNCRRSTGQGAARWRDDPPLL